jgi:diamine N-acetyltransferase
MKNRWLESENMRLRAPEPEDLDLLYTMENDTTLWSVGTTLLPYSRHTLRQYIQQTSGDLYSERQARFVIELKDGEEAGMIDLADYNPFDSRAEVCIGILGKYRGKGIATEALTLLKEYAAGYLGIHQLYAYITAGHTASKKLFEGAGFLHTCTLKEWKREGDDFVDIELYQWLKKHNKY